MIDCFEDMMPIGPCPKCIDQMDLNTASSCWQCNKMYCPECLSETICYQCKEAADANE